MQIVYPADDLQVTESIPVCNGIIDSTPTFNQKQTQRAGGVSIRNMPYR